LLPEATREGEMAKVQNGRFTAEIDSDEIVVFIIGMRVNRPWKVWKWLPVFLAMPRMLAYLKAHPEKGLLGYSGLAPIVQYWRSFEDLDRFARDKDDPHLAPWRKYVRNVGSSGDVGVWHETYRVPASNVEAVYANMPVTRLAAATRHIPVAAKGQSAGYRMGVRASDDVAVPAGN
jgi:hypothetical protein